MEKAKTDKTTIAIDPITRRALKLLAIEEERPMAEIVAQAVAEYSGRSNSKLLSLSR